MNKEKASTYCLFICRTLAFLCVNARCWGLNNIGGSGLLLTRPVRGSVATFCMVTLVGNGRAVSVTAPINMSAYAPALTNRTDIKIGCSFCTALSGTV